MTDVETMGPLFRREAQAVMEEFTVDLTRDIASHAVSKVGQVLDQRIVNPTPYYETQITLDRAVDGHVVHDRGVIYGPWLEGTSERNKTTRFKGYHAFREARQELDQNMGQYTNAALELALRRLQG